MTYNAGAATTNAQYTYQGAYRYRCHPYRADMDTPTPGDSNLCPDLLAGTEGRSGTPRQGPKVTISNG